MGVVFQDPRLICDECGDISAGDVIDGEVYPTEVGWQITTVKWVAPNPERELEQQAVALATEKEGFDATEYEWQSTEYMALDRSVVACPECVVKKGAK